MNTVIQKILSKQFASVALLTLGGVILTSCGSGSSSETMNNVDVSDGSGSQDFVYQGPNVLTEDIQNFKINLYDNLVGDRCGSCHGIDQPPLFLDRSNVNDAYNITNTYTVESESLIDFENPALSRLVTKVGDGHNCWESNNGACAEIMTNYIENWIFQSGSVSNVVVLTAPPLNDPAPNKSFPADVDETLFDTTVYPLLEEYCSECHSDTSDALIQPYFASGNIALAYENARSKMNLGTPESSRFVIKLLNERHNCWDGDCDTSAGLMEDAIREFSNVIIAEPIDEALVASKAVTLADGVIASSGGRVETNVVALYEFKTREGQIAFDTSGVDPAMNLELSDEGVDWLGSYGIRINDNPNANARALTGTSNKLYDTIANGTGEYSIEAWVIPSNVTQEGPARIATYSSGNEDGRNFALGQTLYNYNFLNTSTMDETGNIAVSTADAAEVLQATLQHVVAVYDPVEGRSIYVNGELVAEDDPVAGGTLANWNDSYAFILGNEINAEDVLWQGSIRLLAIYNRVMSPEDIMTNYEAGVGAKYYLLFNIADIIEVPDSYIVFEFQQFDDYSYLFNAPFFVVLSGDGTALGNIPIKGMRIGINAKEAEQGQAFAKLDTNISGAEYAEGGQVLSNVGTVIALENGPEGSDDGLNAPDQFFLTFDTLGADEYVRTENVVATTDPMEVLEQSLIGLKTFEEIDASLSAITGIPRTNNTVAETYSIVRQQMPTSPEISGFLSAHQMGISQLAIQYCAALVDPSNSNRASYFPGFDFNADADDAFDATGRAQVIDPIMEALLTHDVDGTDGSELAEQLDPDVVSTELNVLIDRLVADCGGGCDTDDTRNIVLSTCAAASGSALMLVQ